MKKWIALLLAVVMVLGMFAGCGSKETETTETPATSETDAAETTEESTEATEEETADELFESAAKAAAKAGLVKKGDVVVITAGVPLGVSGNTNMIRVVEI